MSRRRRTYGLGKKGSGRYLAICDNVYSTFYPTVAYTENFKDWTVFGDVYAVSRERYGIDYDTETQSLVISSRYVSNSECYRLSYKLSDLLTYKSFYNTSNEYLGTTYQNGCALMPYDPNARYITGALGSSGNSNNGVYIHSLSDISDTTSFNLNDGKTKYYGGYHAIAYYNGVYITNGDEYLDDNKSVLLSIDGINWKKYGSYYDDAYFRGVLIDSSISNHLTNTSWYNSIIIKSENDYYVLGVGNSHYNGRVENSSYPTIYRFYSTSSGNNYYVPVKTTVILDGVTQSPPSHSNFSLINEPDKSISYIVDKTNDKLYKVQSMTTSTLTLSTIGSLPEGLQAGYYISKTYSSFFISWPYYEGTTPTSYFSSNGSTWTKVTYDSQIVPNGEHRLGCARFIIEIPN